MAGGGREGRSSYTQQDPPTVRGPAGMVETLGETGWEESGGMEGNAASTFPVHLGTGEPVGLPGLILCPQILPPSAQNTSPTPTPPHRAPPLHSETPSENPSNRAGPKPHTHILTQGLTSKLWNSTLWRPSFGCAASLLPQAGPKQRAHPTLELEHHPI